MLAKYRNLECWDSGRQIVAGNGNTVTSRLFPLSYNLARASSRRQHHRRKRGWRGRGQSVKKITILSCKNGGERVLRKTEPFDVMQQAGKKHSAIIVVRHRRRALRLRAIGGEKKRLTLARKYDIPPGSHERRCRRRTRAFRVRLSSVFYSFFFFVFFVRAAAAARSRFRRRRMRSAIIPNVGTVREAVRLRAAVTGRDETDVRAPRSLAPSDEDFTGPPAGWGDGGQRDGWGGWGSAGLELLQRNFFFLFFSKRLTALRAFYTGFNF